ncbi:MAG: hypothetical protein KDI12_04450 [Anaerolineae bacterium]|nr:hypothetical protein [Anaerolineae bacterium]
MTRTALFSRHQPGGVFTIDDLEQHPGDILFVNNTVTAATDATGYGQNPDAPFATLDYAIGQCTASNGDVIYVMPGHAEDLTAADSIDVDVAGIKIIGLGWGALKPTFSTTAAAGSFKVDAANVLVRNLRLVANFATGTTAGMTLTANATNLIVEDCDWRDTSAANEFLLHVTIPTGVGPCTFRDCTFVTAAGSMTNSFLFAGTSTDFTIERCYFFVDSSDSVIDHLAGASTNLRVSDCTIINQDTGAAGYCVQQKSDGTGVVSRCLLAYNKVDAEISVGAATWWFENYATNTIGTSSGVLDPAAGAAVP